MYERLKRLYDAGRITAEGVHKFVTNGIITEEQYREITQANADGGEN